MPRSLFCGAGGHCSQSLIGNKGNRWSWANSSSWKVSYPTPVYAPIPTCKMLPCLWQGQSPTPVSGQQNFGRPLLQPWKPVRSSFQLLLHCLHVLNNPQSSTTKRWTAWLCRTCSKHIRSTKPHMESHQIVFLRPRISLLLKRPLNNKCPCCDATA